MCKSLLCPAYSEQIEQFLIPAMAYSHFPFPFVDLIQALLKPMTTTIIPNTRKKSQKQEVELLLSPWLLGAVVTFANSNIGKEFKPSILLIYNSLYMNIYSN